MKQEAIKRMELLEFHPDVIKAFEEDRLYYSEFDGILYWMDNHPRYIEAVKEFEETYGGKVYHGVFGNYEFGECLTLFFVSKYKGEWKQDYKDLKNGLAYAYVHNFTEPAYSEIGMVSFKPRNGGLKRTG